MLLFLFFGGFFWGVHILLLLIKDEIIFFFDYHYVPMRENNYIKFKIKHISFMILL